MMRSCLYLKVNVVAGTKIEDACQEGVRLAGTLGITVEFDFNSVLVICHDDSSPNRLVEKWNKAMDSNKKYKIAID